MLVQKTVINTILARILLIVCSFFICNMSDARNMGKSETNISIACWNSRGLSSSLPYLHTLLENNDFVCLSEHWLHSNRLNVLNNISNDFHVIARASKHADASVYGYSRGQGGVALFWKKSIQGVSPITNLVHDRVCGVRYQSPSGDIFRIFSVYMPSPGSSDDYQSTLDDIAGFISDDEDNSLALLCGDWNSDLGFLGGPKSNRAPTNLGKKTAKFFKEFSLFAANMLKESKGPVNTFNGGMGSSTLDYLALPVGIKHQVVSCEVIEDKILNLSDHNAVRVDIKLGKIVHTSHCDISVRNIKWSKISRDTLLQNYTTPVNRECQRLLLDNNVSILPTCELDALVDILTNILTSAGQNLPRTKYSQHCRPFWNAHLSELKRKKVACYKEWKDDGCPRVNDAPTWVAHKEAKKVFRREIKKVQRKYERDEINRVLKSAEYDRNNFWRIIKRYRNSDHSKSFSIRDSTNKVVHETGEVVKVWEKHFSKLCSPTPDPEFDQNHFEYVDRKVKEWTLDNDQDEFLNIPFTVDEIRNGIRGLNKGKAAGYDSVTAEHLQNAGENFFVLMTKIFNRIVELEFIPTNFRIGTQIPLYKGKNTCPLDPNNYRGITLLTSLNKVFEMLIWKRIKSWWFEEHVISPLQGACRPGMSCLHTALSLQETIAVGLDSGQKVFVAYFDVSKAFDGVWIDGLFFQLRNMGIVGRVWRLLYHSYQNFWCKARINGQYSEWYRMECGIHQGGYLSLLKYTAFIDPLLRSIENSKIGCCIDGIPTCPLGYADDMAAASVSKARTDRILSMVYAHSKKWRYKYNASKSAIMIYGESKREHEKGKKYRTFKLGPQKVPEKHVYDHVGVKNCLFGDFSERLEDRVSKGRRCFNALCSLGVKKRGISMKTCATLFWSIVIPVATFGCELWPLKGQEIENLRKFQRQLGRRCQRLPDRSPNYSAYVPLGWLSIDRYVQIKKLMFLRTITILDEDAVCRSILTIRAQHYVNDRDRSRINESNSPIFDILNIANDVGLGDTCMNMIVNGHSYAKDAWRKIVWQTIWQREDEDCMLLYKQPKPDNLLFNVIGNSYYLIWWAISDAMPEKMRMCETIASILCDSSLLKTTDYRLKGKTYGYKMCHRCDLGSPEDARHIILQCPYFSDERRNLFEALERSSNLWANEIINNGHDLLHILLGKQPEGFPFDEMLNIWIIAGGYIVDIYESVITGRK